MPRRTLIHYLPQTRNFVCHQSQTSLLPFAPEIIHNGTGDDGRQGVSPRCRCINAVCSADAPYATGRGRCWFNLALVTNHALQNEVVVRLYKKYAGDSQDVFHAKLNRVVQSALKQHFGLERATPKEEALAKVCVTVEHASCNTVR